jgi:hypothetical protein
LPGNQKVQNIVLFLAEKYNGKLLLPNAVGDKNLVQGSKKILKNIYFWLKLTL